MPLEWSQVSLHLKNNNIVEAKKHAMLFEQLAGGTQERTWQTLALEANARVYLQEGNHARAIQYVEAAIKAGKHFETPLADWRVHATAAAAYDAAGDPTKSEKHAALITACIHKLLNSLGEMHSLKRSISSGVSAYSKALR